MVYTGYGPNAPSAEVELGKQGVVEELALEGGLWDQHRKTAEGKAAAEKGPTGAPMSEALRRCSGERRQELLGGSRLQAYLLSAVSCTGAP